MQQDRAGGIWHYHKVPYTTEVRQVSTILKRVVTVYTPRLSTPERFCIHAEAQNTESDGFSGLIRRVYGQVDDQTWLQQGNNVRCVGQVTANGQTDSHDALYTPISGYQPVDWQDGKDMKASFRAYLASHRLEELVS
jgi:hypothetical protein